MGFKHNTVGFFLICEEIWVKRKPMSNDETRSGVGLIHNIQALCHVRYEKSTTQVACGPTFLTASAKSKT